MDKTELRKLIQKFRLNIPIQVLKYYEEMKEEREAMVENIERKGVKDKRVLFTMRIIPRHIFVPEEIKDLAYKDNPLPIGKEQTISQPFIIAFMTENLEIRENHNVLEIGTGSGYHTAILASLANKVITVEISEELSLKAKKRLKNLGFENIEFIVGDGSQGFPELSPYDRICVSAASPDIPIPLLEQLKREGIMVIPIGDKNEQVLSKIIKVGNGKGFIKKELCGCRFVQLKGKFGFS
jgi:protein-L-isoaspartate(D-aspartate) O-methyltransferase